MNNQFSEIQFDNKIKELTEHFTGREWVFKEIERWMQQENTRFFILTGEPGVGKSAIAARLIEQKEQKNIAAYNFCITGRGETIEPNRVLCSLGAQLIKYFPNYTDALLKTLPLQPVINVNIEIGSAQNTNVQGVVINSLHTSNAKHLFNIILSQSLTYLGNLEEQHHFIIIDSLDEAVTFSESENLVTLLSQIEDLPSWIRFILTSRPERRVLSELESLNQYTCTFPIKNKSEDSLNDICKYVTKQVEDNKLIIQIQKYQVDCQTLIKKLTSLSTGNFLYIKILLDNIKNNEQSLDNLEDLPKGLDDIYHRFLLRLEFEDWQEKYQRILGKLAVVQEPITERKLASFTAIYPREIREDLKVLRQFLNISVREADNTKVYTIFHQSFRDYLLNEKRNQDFWCDVKEENDKIINYYKQKKETWKECNFKELDEENNNDNYGLRYLFQHLLKANRESEIHELLAIRTSQGYSIWFQRKSRINDLAGYLADIALAWEIAEADKEFDTDPLQSIVLQCHYALITSSLNSLIEDIPTQLIIELLKKDPTKGLDYFRQKITIFNQQLQEYDLLTLRKLQPDQFCPELVEKIFEEIERVSDYDYQILIKSALVQLLPELPLDILEEVQNIKDEKVRVQALTLLIPKLSLLPDKYPGLIQVMNKIDEEENKKNILVLLARYSFDKNLPDILEKSKEFNEQYLADIMIALAPRLTTKLLEIALDIVLNIFSSNQNEYALTRAFCGLVSAPTLTENMIKTIQEKAKLFQNDNLRLYVMIALIPHLSLEQKNLILQQIQEIHEIDQLFLNQIGVYLPQNLLYKALENVQLIHNESYKNAIKFLETSIKQEEVKKYELFDYFYSDSPLKTLSDQGQKFEEDSAINDITCRIETIVSFVAALPNDQQSEILQNLKLLEEIRKIQNQSHKAEALGQFAAAPNLSVNLAKDIQQEAIRFQNQEHRIQVISKLAKYLPEELLQEILVETTKIKNCEERAKALSILSFSLSQRQLRDEIQKLLVTEEYHYDDDIQNAIMDEVFIDLYPSEIVETSDLSLNIEEECEHLPDASCLILSNILTTLALHLPLEKLLEQLDDLTQHLEGIKEFYFKAEVLIYLASRLPVEKIQYVIQQLEIINNNYNYNYDYYSQKLKVLSELSPRLLPNSTLSDSLYNQLYDQYRYQVLDTLLLMPEIMSNEPYEILQNLHKYNDKNSDNFKSLVLRALIPLFPLDEFLDIAKAIQNKSVCADTLIAIVPQLVKLPPKDLYKLWTEDIIHIISRRNRRQLLLDLQKLKPIISVLCNQKSGETEKENAIVKIIHAIQDVGKQWP